MQFVKPLPFEEAMAKLGARRVITSNLDSAAWREVPVGLRERAFFSSRVESARFLDRTKRALNEFLASERETLPNGQTALKTGGRAAFVEAARKFAQAEGMGPLDPKDKGGLKDITSQKRLELIFDTQTRQAEDYGYWLQGQDQDVLDAFPAQRFVRENEVKEPRDYHRQFEGEVRLKNDLAFWRTVNRDFGVPWGPWGWGCGHDVEDVDREEAEALGLLKPGERPIPAQTTFNADLAASVRGLDPDLITKLQDAFGDQVEIRNGKASWTGRPAAKAAPQPQPAAPAETLDELLKAYLKSKSITDQRVLAQRARDLLSIPAANRGKVRLKHETSSADIKNTAQQGAFIVERYTARELIENMGEIKVRASRSHRAFYSGGSINLNGTYTSVSTAAHEITHGIEKLNPQVLTKCADYLLKRGKLGGPVETLKKLTGNRGYKSHEVALPDKWVERGGSNYCGKVYAANPHGTLGSSDINYTEVLTMGIERLHRDPLLFASTDRDYFDFIVKTLANK